MWTWRHTGKYASVKTEVEIGVMHGAPRIASSYRKLGGRRGTDFFFEPPRRNQSC